MAPPDDAPDLAALEADWARYDAAPRGPAVLTCVVQRTSRGVHATPARAAITVEHGLAGDRWGAHPRRARSRQITVMDARVARFLGGRAGQPDDAPGDNLLVDLPVGEATLGVGDRLHVGDSVILEVTAAPHLGCKTFHARFGAAALAWVNAPEGIARKLRGVNCRVIAGGDVAVGDPVRVAHAGA